MVITNEIKCVCKGCDNKLRVSIHEETAELLIFEKSEHTGHRKSIIVSLELGEMVHDWMVSYYKKRLASLTTAEPDVCTCGHTREQHSFFEDHDECDHCYCETGFTPVS